MPAKSREQEEKPELSVQGWTELADSTHAAASMFLQHPHVVVVAATRHL